MRAFALLVLLAVVLPGPAEAFNLIGQGTQSCGTWTATRRAGKAFGFEQWVLGFLSGVGWIGPDDPMLGTDAEGVWAWIDNYCRAHPIDPLANAAGQFDIVHHPH